MKNIFRFMLILVVAVSIGSAAHAQTPYSTTAFSASFNGTVTAETSTNNGSTSTNYTSCDGNICEAIQVRILQNDISVDASSADYYRDQNVAGYTLDTTFNVDGTFQGHPYAYGFYTNTDGPVIHGRFIVVNSREVIFIMLERPNSIFNGPGVFPEWSRFENSLTIN